VCGGACAVVRVLLYLFAQVLQVGDGVVEQVQEGLRGKELSCATNKYLFIKNK
jgi:hypothetical protein